MTTLQFVSIFSGVEAAFTDTFLLDWGQNSYGAANPNNQTGWQKPLQDYCNDDTIDMIPIAFLTDFNVTGLPSINLANVSTLQFDLQRLTFTF